MNCVFGTIIKGTAIKKIALGERIMFYSFKKGCYIEGVVRDDYSNEYGAKIVQYKWKGKNELAIVESKITYQIAVVPIVANIATTERLVYISEVKNGMAIAVSKAIHRLNVILLNERGECVQNIGQRKELINKRVRGKTNREWIQHEKSLQFMR